MDKEQIIAKAKSFLVGALKASLGFFIAFLIIFLVTVAYEKHQKNIVAEKKRLKAESNKELSVPITWPDKYINALGRVKVSLSTKWHSRSFFYNLQIHGNPLELRKAVIGHKKFAGKNSKNLSLFKGFKPLPLSRPSKINRSVFIKFLDSDKFEVFEVTLPVGALDRWIDENGETIGWKVSGEEYIDSDKYRNFSAWELSYDFDF
jgi:hypothetical protein